MKAYAATAAAVLIALTATSCGNGSDATEAELRYAAEAGRRDALRAVGLRDKVMECEKAVLGIRIRENELRDNGYDDCADSYSEAARTVLQDSLLIE